MFEKGERIDYLSKKGEALESRPHVSLWQSNPSPHEVFPEKGYERKQNRYVCLNFCEKKRGQRLCYQRNLTNWFLYSRALSEAITWGKLLNLVVVKHDIVDMVVLWAPQSKSAKKHKRRLKDLLKSKVSVLRVDG